MSQPKPYIRLDKNDAAMLLVDHQTGLLSLVRDIDPDKFKNNVLATANLAKYFGLPTILTSPSSTPYVTRACANGAPTLPYTLAADQPFRPS